MSIQRIVGIDFGTSTTVMKVKSYQDDKPVGADLLSEESVRFDGKPTVPTLIRECDDEYFICYEAEQDVPDSVLYRNFKVDFLSSDKERKAKGRKLIQIFFDFLHQTYREQSNYLGPMDEEITYVSYPAKTEPEEIEFMLETAQKAGFSNVKGMDEASAAIQTVMIKEADRISHLAPIRQGDSKNILIVDMGAGTTDLALCRYQFDNCTCEVLDTWPKDNQGLFFGGSEIDKRITDYFVGFLKEHQAPSYVIEQFPSRYLEQCKAWKENTLSPRLSKGQAVRLCAFVAGIFSMLGVPVPDFTPIDQMKFETLNREYLEQFPKLITDCIEHARGSNPYFAQHSQVDYVILTGGHSQWYCWEKILSGKVPQIGRCLLPLIEEQPQRIIRLAQPQETVARGLVYTKLNGEIEFSQMPEVHEISSQEEKGSAPIINNPISSDNTVYADELDERVVYIIESILNNEYTLLPELEKAAENNLWALIFLGTLYYEGCGEPENHDMAFQCWNRLANSGNALGTYLVAGCYYYGIGTKENDDQFWNRIQKNIYMDNHQKKLVYPYGALALTLRNHLYYGNYYIESLESFIQGWGLPAVLPTSGQDDAVKSIEDYLSLFQWLFPDILNHEEEGLLLTGLLMYRQGEWGYSKNIFKALSVLETENTLIIHIANAMLSQYDIHRVADRLVASLWKSWKGERGYHFPGEESWNRLSNAAQKNYGATPLLIYHDTIFGSDKSGFAIYPDGIGIKASWSAPQILHFSNIVPNEIVLGDFEPGLTGLNGFSKLWFGDSWAPIYFPVEFKENIHIFKNFIYWSKVFMTLFGQN